MKSKKDVKTFINESKVDAIVSDLKKMLIKDGKMPVYSDIYKIEGKERYQYVNYVQEGGGVLGVALVGYTYVLEKLGFRFLKLAGTSAGAINTIMLAAVDKKNDPTYAAYETKSEIILHEMLQYDLWKFVDGSRFGKWLISLAINSTSRLIFLICLFLTSLVISLLYVLFKSILWAFNLALNESVNTIVSYVAFISIGIFLIYCIITIYYLYRFDRAGFGINPGNAFYDWIKSILQRNGISTRQQLDNIMNSRFANLILHPDPKRPAIENNTTIDPPYLTIVSSDITNQTKVEFPLMAKDYWSSPALVNPAEFVRASMSIPIFFEPYKVVVDASVINSSSLQQNKLVGDQFAKIAALPKANNPQALQTPNVSYTVRFVDGGILSNFPINIFHNPKIKRARMPTFGVKLEDKKHQDVKGIEKIRLKFFPFLFKIFSTVRYYYDRDFLKKNEVYEKCIGHIDVADFNWLDFGLDDETKSALFIKGAEAAKVFFLGGDVWIDGRLKTLPKFDWAKFKDEREEKITC